MFVIHLHLYFTQPAQPPAKHEYQIPGWHLREPDPPPPPRKTIRWDDRCKAAPDGRHRGSVDAGVQCVYCWEVMYRSRDK